MVHLLMSPFPSAIVETIRYIVIYFVEQHDVSLLFPKDIRYHHTCQFEEGWEAYFLRGWMEPGDNWCSLSGNSLKSSGVGGIESLSLAGDMCNEHSKQPLNVCHIIERKIPMADGLPVRSTGRWTFHLQVAQTLQFRISSEQGASGHIIIEGHDISTLLDFLYDHRELIFDATHDQETRRLEAMEAFDGPTAAPAAERRVERILYFDDGIERTRANI
jgi:hypothetical protein